MHCKSVLHLAANPPVATGSSKTRYGVGSPVRINCVAMHLYMYTVHYTIWHSSTSLSASLCILSPVSFRYQ